MLVCPLKRSWQRTSTAPTKQQFELYSESRNWFSSVLTSPKDRKRDIGDYKKSSKAWTSENIGRNPVVVSVAISPKISTESKSLSPIFGPHFSGFLVI